MKIALLVLLGLVLCALGGAALGIGTGLAWIEISKTSNLEGHSGMLVFFTFMRLGAILGGLAGAITFGVLAWRDAEIAIERRPNRRESRSIWNATAFVQCKNAGWFFETFALFLRPTVE